jgi:hypothetical protein
MNNEKQIGFSYGVLSDPLESQAREQGYILKDAEKFENIKKSINMCGFHVATESQINQMFNKLHKKVIASLTPIEE